jgi:RNA polymerase sigma factor (sigma-70 family)
MKEQKSSDSELDEIWKNFLSGDDKSFDLLYSRYIQILFYYGLQFTADRELLKDCIQDTFVKIYEAREQLYHVSNISVYLRIAFKNRLINSLNREKIYLKSTDIPNIPLVEENTTDQHIIHEEEILQKLNKIEKMMNLLTPQQKKVVYYRYVKGWSLEKISIHMEVNYQSIQNTLQRAIKKIKKFFYGKVSIKNWPDCPIDN